MIQLTGRRFILGGMSWWRDVFDRHPRCLFLVEQVWVWATVYLVVVVVLQILLV